MSRREVFIEIAKYIPDETRRDLVRRLFEINERSIKQTAQDMKTSRIQLYRYLGFSKRKNYPSDSVTARLLEALYAKHPKEVVHILREQAARLNRLIDQL